MIGDETLNKLINAPLTDDTAVYYINNLTNYILSYALNNKKKSNITDELDKIVALIMIKIMNSVNSNLHFCWERIDLLLTNLEKTLGYYSEIEPKLEEYLKDELLSNPTNYEQILERYRILIESCSLKINVSYQDNKELFYNFLLWEINNGVDITYYLLNAELKEEFDDLRRQYIAGYNNSINYTDDNIIELFNMITNKTDQDIKVFFSKCYEPSKKAVFFRVANTLSKEQIEKIDINSFQGDYFVNYILYEFTNPASIDAYIEKNGISFLLNNIERDNDNNHQYSDYLICKLLELIPKDNENVQFIYLLLSKLSDISSLINEVITCLDSFSDDQLINQLDSLLSLENKDIVEYLVNRFTVENVVDKIMLPNLYFFKYPNLAKILLKYINKEKDPYLYNYCVVASGNLNLIEDYLDQSEFIDFNTAFNDKEVLLLFIKKYGLEKIIKSFGYSDNFEVYDCLLSYPPPFNCKKQWLDILYRININYKDYDSYVLDKLKKYEKYFSSNDLMNIKMLVTRDNLELVIYLIDKIGYENIEGYLNTMPFTKPIAFALLKYEKARVKFKDNYLKILPTVENSNNVINTLVTLNDVLSADEIIEVLKNFNQTDHIINNLDYSTKYRPLFEKVANYLNLDVDRLLFLATKIGASVLLICYDSKMREILDLEEKAFQRFVELFSIKNNNMNSFNDSITAIKANDFNSNSENMYIVQIFNIIVGLIPKRTDSPSKYEESKAKISTILDEICNTVNVSDFNITKEELLNGILINDQKILNLLHDFIVNKYITMKRFEYVDIERLFFLENNIAKVYQNKDYFKELIHQKSTDEIIKLLKKIDISLLTESEQKLVNNEDLLKTLINWRKDPKNVALNAEIKKNVHTLESICKHISYSDLNLNMEKYNPHLDFESLSSERATNINDLICIMDVQRLYTNILSNDELYNHLKSIIEQYNLFDWLEMIRLINKTGSTSLDFDHDTLMAFITDYSQIALEHESFKESIAGDIDIAGCLISSAKVYINLLNMDNFKIFKANRGPNKTSMNYKERINIAISLLKQMHNRKTITIPPLDKEIQLSETKSINVAVGDTYDPINLTYGERTGSCMRVGGAGRSLLEFCLCNKNGFHISFTNPETGCLVSRMSGFRNGPTLCLNQLRNSLDPLYTNEDLVKACREFSEIIIAETKNSKYPITNVVAAQGYALSANMFEGRIYDGDFTDGYEETIYNDYRNSYMLLATSNNGDIQLGPEKALEYPVARGKVKLLDNKQAINAINHIHALDDLFQDKDISEIEERISENDKPQIIAFVGEDWYVAIINNNVTYYISKTSRDKEAALNEYRRYCEEIKKYISMNQLNQQSQIYEDFEESINEERGKK